MSKRWPGQLVNSEWMFSSKQVEEIIETLFKGPLHEHPIRTGAGALPDTLYCAVTRNVEDDTMFVEVGP